MLPQLPRREDKVRRHCVEPRPSTLIAHRVHRLRQPPASTCGRRATASRATVPRPPRQLAGGAVPRSSRSRRPELKVPEGDDPCRSVRISISLFLAQCHERHQLRHIVRAGSSRPSRSGASTRQAALSERLCGPRPNEHRSRTSGQVERHDGSDHQSCNQTPSGSPSTLVRHRDSCAPIAIRTRSRLVRRNTR